MSGRDVVLVGCGRLGSAILEGWLKTGAVPAERLIVLTPSPKPASEMARASGSRVNPPLDQLASAGAVVIAVKPAIWREALAPLLPHLSPDAVMVSVMAGVSAAATSDGSGGRAVVRLMPTTAVAQARGVAAIWTDDANAAAVGRALFAPIADLVELADEADLHAATAVSGCAPAFVQAFVLALAEAGAAKGLSLDASLKLARGALRSAAATAETGEPLEVLIDRVASPGGVTRAGLDAMASGGVSDLAAAAVEAAIRRSREIG